MIKTKKKPTIFKPVITPGQDYKGNIKAKGNSIEFKQLKTFLSKYFTNYIITIESRHTDNEHCHFWANQIKLKPSINNRTTLANYLRRDIPTLKRDGQGGSNRYDFNIMNEPFQFYYIFKEQTEKTLKDITSLGYKVDMPLLKQYIQYYKQIHSAKKKGRSNEFRLHCIDKYGVGSKYLKRREMIIETYMDWCQENGSCPTTNLCDRYVNGVLNQFSHSQLTQDFKNIILDKYNKQYFT